VVSQSFLIGYGTLSTASGRGSTISFEGAIPSRVRAHLLGEALQVLRNTVPANRRQRIAELVFSCIARHDVRSGVRWLPRNLSRLEWGSARVLFHLVAGLLIDNGNT